MASETMLLNDLPEELLLKIFSCFGAEELSLIIAKVCQQWNTLAKDVALWKAVSYKCDSSSGISHFKEVSTNYPTNVDPCTVLKVQNLKEHLRNWISFHPE